MFVLKNISELNNLLYLGEPGLHEERQPRQGAAHQQLRRPEGGEQALPGDSPSDIQQR